MDRNSVSIIIPAYNAENTIDIPLRSIKNMKFKNVEVIIVDDGSKNGYHYLKRKYPSLDIRIFENDHNRGVSYTKDFGVSKAKCPWVTFLDSDDAVSRNFLEEFNTRDYCLNGFPEKLLIEYAHIDIRQFIDVHQLVKRKPSKLFLKSDMDILVEKFNQNISSFFTSNGTPDSQYPIMEWRNGQIYALSHDPTRLWVEHGKVYRKALIDRFNITHPEGVTFGDDTYFNKLFFYHCKPKEIYQVHRNGYIYMYTKGSLTNLVDSDASSQNYFEKSFIPENLKMACMLNKALRNELNLHPDYNKKASDVDIITFALNIYLFGNNVKNIDSIKEYAFPFFLEELHIIDKRDLSEVLSKNLNMDDYKDKEKEIDNFCEYYHLWLDSLR